MSSGGDRGGMDTADVVDATVKSNADALFFSSDQYISSGDEVLERLGLV